MPVIFAAYIGRIGIIFALGLFSFAVAHLGHRKVLASKSAFERTDICSSRDLAERVFRLYHEDYAAGWLCVDKIIKNRQGHAVANEGHIILLLLSGTEVAIARGTGYDVDVLDALGFRPRRYLSTVLSSPALIRWYIVAGVSAY